MTTPQGRLHRDIIRLRGADTLPFLQGLLTNDVGPLADGQSRHAALLTPQGKILFTIFVTHADDALWLDTPAGFGKPLAQRLTLYRMRAKIDIDDVTDQACIIVGEAPAGSAPLWSGPDPRLDALGHRHLVNADIDAENVGDAYAAFLIENGVPDLNAGYSDNDAFPLGVNMDALNGIDHQKGCFVGQEVASRMFRKGEIRKRTWCIHGPGLIVGSSLKADGTTVGEITAVSGNIGLASVRIDRLGEQSAAEVTLTEGSTARLQQPAYLS